MLFVLILHCRPSTVSVLTVVQGLKFSRGDGIILVCVWSRWGGHGLCMSARLFTNMSLLVQGSENLIAFRTNGLALHRHVCTLST